MHGGKARDNSVVAQLTVPCNARVATDDAVVADLAVVTAVGVDEEIVVTADDGFCFVCGRAVDVAILAEDIVIAYLEVGRLALVLEILRAKTDDGEGVELIAHAEGRRTIEYDMIMQYTAFCQLYMSSNDTVGANLYIVSDFGLGINNSSRVYISHVIIISIWYEFSREKKSNPVLLAC